MNEGLDKQQSIINDEIFIKDQQLQRMKESKLGSQINISRTVPKTFNDLPSIIQSHDKSNFEVNSALITSTRPQIKYQIETKAVEDYKKTIRIRIFAVAAILCLLLFGRILASLGTETENNIVIWFQTLIGVSEQPSWYAQLFTYIGYSQFFDMMLVAHFYVSFYFLYKPIFCLKVIVVHVVSTSLVPNLQMIFADPRPFWVSEDIYSIDCPNSYPYPSLTVFTIPFLFLYAGKVMSQEEENPKYLRMFTAITVALYFYITITELYAGFLYSYQIILSLFYTSLYYIIVQIYDKQLDELLEKSSIDIRQAKRYSIFWLIFVLFFVFFCTLVYESSKEFLNTSWIENFYECLINNDRISDIDNVPYNHVLGAWPSFINTATIFIILGAIFGTAKTFRDLKGMLWYESDFTKRFKMALVGNLFLIPSWIYFYYVYQKQGLVTSGILAYLTIAVQYVINFYIIFGVLPKYLFDKLEWTNRNSSVIQF